MSGTEGKKNPPVTQVEKVRREDDRRRKVKVAKFLPDTSEPVEVKPGKPLSPRYVWGLVKRLAAKGGLGEWVHPHALRHSAAMRLWRSSGDMEIVRAHLGHTTTAVTRLYAEAENRDLAKAVEELEAKPEPEPPEPSPAELLMKSLTPEQRRLFRTILDEANDTA